MRWKWVIVTIGLLVIVSMAAVYAVLASFDYNKLKPQLEQMVKDATGRELNLRGGITFTIGVPPALIVTDAALRNAPWGSQAQMITVAELRIELRLLPLLARDVVLRYLGLSGVEVLLETDSDGQGNWEFKEDRRPGKNTATHKPLKIAIGRVHIENLRIVYRRGSGGPADRYTLDRFDVKRQEAADRLAIDLRARYNEHPLAVSGRIGMLRNLQTPEPFPVELSGTFSDARIQIEGVIDDILHLQGIALKTHISGADLASLGLDKTIPLPTASAFDVTGLLKGDRDSAALNDINGRLSGPTLDLIFSGSVGDLFTFNAVDLKLSVGGQDLSMIGPMIGQKLPATDKFNFLGRLQGSAQSLSFGDAQANASRGSMHVDFDGEVKDLLNFSGLDLRAKASGKDLTEMTPIIGVKLPATDDFAIEGRIEGSTKLLRLEAAQGRAQKGHLNLTLNGRIQDLLAFSGLDLQGEWKGTDLAEAGEIFDVQLPTTDAFAVQGRLTGSAQSLSLEEARASADRGNIRVVANGTVKDLLAIDGLDLKVKGSGQNLAAMAPIFGVKLPATDGFAVAGRLAGSSKSLSFHAAQASAERGRWKLELSGGVEGLLAGTTINLDVHASGAELAEIGPLVGTDLPELGPFDVTAKLSGSAKAVSLSGVSASIDKSDLEGQATVALLERPRITARLASSVIDFTRLMENFGQDEKKPTDQNPQQHRLFPDAPLPFEAFKKVDADILLKARNIRARDARLEFGHLSLKLDRGDLRIDRIEATYKKTKISGNLDIRNDTPPHVAVKFLVQDFDLGEFLRETGWSDTVQAVVDIAAYGNSTGNSVHELTAHLNGAIGAVMGKGYLSRYLNMLSLNLSQKVLSFWDWARRHREKADQIDCAVVQFDIQKGIATSKAFVFDSQLAILTGEGTINLGTEQIDFLLVPDAKDPSLGLSTNLRVRGSLMDPKVRPDTRSLLTQGSWALSSLAIGPLGLLAPFVHLGAHKTHPCDVPGIGAMVHGAAP